MLATKMARKHLANFPEDLRMAGARRPIRLSGWERPSHPSGGHGGAIRPSLADLGVAADT